MSEGNRPDEPSSDKKGRLVMIIAVATGLVLTLALALALVIHFVLLSTDRFNWLEAPKHSSLAPPRPSERSDLSRDA